MKLNIINRIALDEFIRTTAMHEVPEKTAELRFLSPVLKEDSNIGLVLNKEVVNIELRTMGSTVKKSYKEDLKNKFNVNVVELMSNQLQEEAVRNITLDILSEYRRVVTKQKNLVGWPRGFYRHLI